MNPWMFILFMYWHWMSDFVFQRHSWSTEKWHSPLALSKHVGTLSLILLLAVFLMGAPLAAGLWFVVINGGSHWLIDFVTSKGTHSLYEQGRVHDFFVLIGFDQFLHTSIMYATFLLLF